MNWAKAGKTTEKMAIGAALAFGLLTSVPEGVRRECCGYPQSSESQWVESDEDRDEQAASDWLLGHGLIAVLAMGILQTVRNKMQPEKKKG